MPARRVPRPPRRQPPQPDLVLKGGALLAAYGTRRPTRDVDLLATDPHVDTDTVLAIVRDIATQARDDGLDFDPTSAAAHIIRDEDEYSGVRVSMTATLGRARLTFHVGDPVWPAPGPVTVPGLLGGHFADVYLLRAQQDVDGTDLTTAMAKVADYRGVTLRPLSETLTGYAQLGQTRSR